MGKKPVFYSIDKYSIGCIIWTYGMPEVNITYWKNSALTGLWSNKDMQKFQWDNLSNIEEDSFAI